MSPGSHDVVDRLAHCTLVRRPIPPNSLSVEHWRPSNVQKIEVVSRQEMQDRILDSQRDLIRSLEQDLQRQRETTNAVHKAVATARTPVRPPHIKLLIFRSQLNFVSPLSSKGEFRLAKR
ncbi:hypothetical protein HRG_012231 [Hirsutella rhossiliensis]